MLPRNTTLLRDIWWGGHVSFSLLSPFSVVIESLLSSLSHKTLSESKDAELRFTLASEGELLNTGPVFKQLHVLLESSFRGMAWMKEREAWGGGMNALSSAKLWVELKAQGRQ